MCAFLYLYESPGFICFENLFTSYLYKHRDYPMNPKFILRNKIFKQWLKSVSQMLVCLRIVEMYIQIKDAYTYKIKDAYTNKNKGLNSPCSK